MLGKTPCFNGGNNPVTGKWNYDKENQKLPKKS
jgi:deoxyribodipyrimidine photolyase-like uncharacterized protein